MTEKRTGIYYFPSASVFSFGIFSNKFYEILRKYQFTVVVQHQFTPHYVPVLDIFKIFVSEAVRKRSQ
jgi:hypothetical protein